MYNSEKNEFEMISEAQAKMVEGEYLKRLFREGEEVQIKGVIFIIAVLHHKSIVLKPIRLA